MSAHYPILSAAFWRRSGSAGGAPEGDIYEVDALGGIAAYPGPAILFAEGGRVLAANAEAARLLKANDAQTAPEMRILLAGVAATGRPAVGQIFLPSDPLTGAPQALYYLTALALAPPNLPVDQHTPHNRRVMMLARDGSAEYAMRNALIESRELYRDLSHCSSDFSWQTDENGAFTYVSLKGALGYSAQALNGRRSQDILVEPDGAAGTNPFMAREPVENIEITILDADGGRRYCRVDAVPVYDRSNHWRGTRGVSTDITEAKLHRQTLEFMRQREAQVRAIVDATHHSLDPAKAFGDAAALLANSAAAHYCAILGFDNKRRMRVLGEFGAVQDQPGAAALSRIEVVILESQTGNDTAPIQFSEDGQLHQITCVSHGGAVNGAIWIKCHEGESGETPPPGQDAELPSLVASVAPHMGMAIAHDNQMRQLAELSRTDELTGLLNRRAFMEDLYKHHAHLYRGSRKGALLYIDLDNFKPVNDRFGHAAGDAVLKQFANILQNHSRIGDLPARLGGDEFAIWLEETDETGASVKALNLINEAKSLHRLAGIDAPADMPPLGLSIGIAIADPQFFEELPQLINRADEVMYQVKRQGKGTLIIAPSAGQQQTRKKVDG